MLRPFSAGQNLLMQATPMGDVLVELMGQLAELKAYKDAAEVALDAA